MNFSKAFTLRIPKVEDEYNFGSSFQEEILHETAKCERVYFYKQSRNDELMNENKTEEDFR